VRIVAEDVGVGIETVTKTLDRTKIFDPADNYHILHDQDAGSTNTEYSGAIYRKFSAVVGEESTEIAKIQSWSPETGSGLSLNFIPLSAGALAYLARGYSYYDAQYVFVELGAMGHAIRNNGTTVSIGYFDATCSVDKKGASLVAAEGLFDDITWDYQNIAMLVDQDGTLIADTTDIRELIGIPAEDDHYAIHPIRSLK